MSRLNTAQENPYQSGADLVVNAPQDAATNSQRVLTVLGKLNVGIGFAGAFFSIIIGFGLARVNAPLVPNEIAFRTFQQLGCVVWGGLSVGLVVAGVGLLNRKRFGWSLSVICAWLFIILQVVENVVRYVLVGIPEMTHVMRLSPGVGGAVTVMQTVLVDLGVLLLALSYPIALMIFLHRSDAVRTMRN